MRDSGRWPRGRAGMNPERRAVAVIARDFKLAFDAARQEAHGRAVTADVAHVDRAAEVVHVLHAADAAEDHGRPALAWLLRRFATYLRAEPLGP